MTFTTSTFWWSFFFCCCLKWTSIPSPYREAECVFSNWCHHSQVGLNNTSSSCTRIHALYELGGGWQLQGSVNHPLRTTLLSSLALGCVPGPAQECIPISYRCHPVICGDKNQANITTPQSACLLQWWIVPVGVLKPIKVKWLFHRHRIDLFKA